MSAFGVSGRRFCLYVCLTQSGHWVLLLPVIDRSGTRSGDDMRLHCRRAGSLQVPLCSENISFNLAKAYLLSLIHFRSAHIEWWIRSVGIDGIGSGKQTSCRKAEATPRVGTVTGFDHFSKQAPSRVRDYIRSAARSGPSASRFSPIPLSWREVIRRRSNASGQRHQLGDPSVEVPIQ
jgi:hypothetical protein